MPDPRANSKNRLSGTISLCQLYCFRLYSYTFKESVNRNIGLEVIFVSSDEDEEKFWKYFTTEHGPWYAVPYNDDLAQ